MIEGFNLTGYLLFALVTSITPGPNNYLLFSYGKQYGFTDSHKFMLGIFVGFSALLYMAGYGIGELITQYPTLHLILKGISSVWLFYLAIVMSKLEIGLPEQTNSKMGFYQGFFLQFVNPKAWIMSITGASAYYPKWQISIGAFSFLLFYLV